MEAPGGPARRFHFHFGARLECMRKPGDFTGATRSGGAYVPRMSTALIVQQSETAVCEAVAVRDLVVVRGGHAVLPGISLSIKAGSVTGLLGPSGSGKSTLLRSIVGVQTVTSGEVEVLGLPAGSAGLRTRVAFMTQSLSVYRDLTVSENLRYFARILDVPRADVDSVLELVELTTMADREVERLSGGQKARVSLATALLGRPEFLVLDEPTVGLDPVLRQNLWDLFDGLAADGCTLLVSSHVMDEATHCDELLMLRDGQLLASGPPEDLLAQTGAVDLEAAFIAMISEETGR
jgi:ABC-2 type transport system ATP-binding protein